MPDERARAHIAYRDILRSMAAIARAHPELRRSAALGALGFGSFSVFWTTIAFRLSGAPFHYADSAIGLLGLVGAAGALCASVAGRLADRGHAHIGRVGAASAIGLAFAVLYVGRNSIVVVIIGVLVLDIGVQGLQVLNQSTIYELVSDARSRITGVYMTTYFVGGALGSAGGSFAYEHGHWRSVCIVGVCMGCLAAGIAMPRPKPSTPVVVAPAPTTAPAAMM